VIDPIPTRRTCLLISYGAMWASIVVILLSLRGCFICDGEGVSSARTEPNATPIDDHIPALGVTPLSNVACLAGVTALRVHFQAHDLHASSAHSVTSDSPREGRSKSRYRHCEAGPERPGNVVCERR
jgi:hypothetical protein